MLKKAFATLLTLAALAFSVGFVTRACAAEETKIRWLVESMEEAYDTGRAGACVAPLAHDWRHEGYEVDRQLLLGALFQASRERERETKRLLSSVEIDEEAAEITVEGARATLAVEAYFSRLRRGEWEPAWSTRIEAELEKRDGDWEVVRSRHCDLAGTHLGR